MILVADGSEEGGMMFYPFHGFDCGKGLERLIWCVFGVHTLGSLCDGAHLSILSGEVPCNYAKYGVDARLNAVLIIYITTSFDLVCISDN